MRYVLSGLTAILREHKLPHRTRRCHKRQTLKQKFYLLYLKSDLAADW